MSSVKTPYQMLNIMSRIMNRLVRNLVAPGSSPEARSGATWCESEALSWSSAQNRPLEPKWLYRSNDYE